MSNKFYIVLIFVTLAASQIYAQPMEKEFGYFIFPIKPGERNTLSGTMGELRSTHLHTGIDIRTGGVEGLSVRAAADGYITRIKVSPGGYGNTIYVLHPNGKTTVYAHLKSFRSDIEAYVKDAQYSKESFEVDLFPKGGQFEVKQGDTLALSGNSGSSGGPHLHFDIRDENQNLLNPLKYGFDEIIDTRSPYAKSLAIQTFNKDARADGAVGHKEYNLAEVDGDFLLRDTINAIGDIGIELYAWDRMDGTRFKTGIVEIKLFINEELVYNQNIDTWSFSRARSFYQHVNYETLVTEGKRYNKLYIDNGNNLRFYKALPANGELNIAPDKYYNGLITMTDSYGNTSSVKFIIYGDANAPDKTAAAVNSYGLNIARNTLIINGDTASADSVGVKLKDEVISISYSYLSAGGTPVYLWDLNAGIPEAILFPDTTIESSLLSMVPPKQEYKIFNEHADILFNKSSLFDTVYFNLTDIIDSTTQIEKLVVGNVDVPVKGTITVLFKPKAVVKDKEHAAVYSVYDNNYSYAGGVWQGEQIEFKTRNFGEFAIVSDTIPPEVKPLVINKDRIFFKMDDALSGIKDIRATLNGQWLLIAKDPKKKNYWAEPHNLNENYQGDLVIEVADNAGNTTIYKSNIN